MSDTSFGSGLSVGGANGPGDSADVPLDPRAGAPLSLTPPAAAPEAPTSSPGGGGIFGSGMSMGGPRYTAPDPNASPLDQTADLLSQRVKRANEIAANPLAQFFDPEAAQAARDFVPKATEALQTIKKQKADMAANRQQAATLGLEPGAVADEASEADRVEVAKARALKGDLSVFKGLQAVKPEAAAAIQDQVYETVGGHLTKAQFAFDKLSNMRNQGEYIAAVNSLRKDGTLTDLEALGLKVPDSFENFNAAKGREGQALREARQGMENLKAKLAERANGSPMEKKEAETYKGRLTTESGQEVNNITWQRTNGQRNAAINGGGDIHDLGKKFSFADAEQRKAIEEQSEKLVDKQEREKYRAFNRTYQLATTDAKGEPIGEGKINTNPNVQQGVAEGLASMLRGGSGGANVGLLKIETGKRAYVQNLLDTIKANYAGGVNEISGKDTKAYLTNLTQKQVRDVMDVIKAYNDQSIGDRAKSIARRAGELGLDASALGFAKGEAPGIEDAIKEGTQSTIDRFGARHRAIGGGDGAIFLDNPPPVSVTDPPHPPGSVAPLPPPVAQPSAPPPVPNGGTAPPASPVSPGPAGGAPITIAGQSVPTPPLPPGASPNYLLATQRIESGNEKDPWTAGNDKSSAKGAFQFIKSTWAANKPTGAPDDPRKATPQQQTEAVANLTAKNAAALANYKLPVTDTNLYVLHNLGSGAGPALLTSSPTADARAVVGEDAAKNNPMFFRGRPTVATVLQRYNDAMAGNVSNKSGEPAKTDTAAQPPTFMQRMLSQAGEAGQASAGVESYTPEELAKVEKNAQDALPIIGSTAGSVAGGVFGGVPGGMIGGSVGGAGGQMLKDKMQGRPQNPTEIAKQAGLGGVLGVSSVARPAIAAGARILGSAAVEGGAKAIEGGDAGEIADEAIKGGGFALGGEALGRFISALGPVAHKVLSNYLPSAQKELSAQAGKLSEARKVLETEQPKLPGANGTSSPNPKYDAAKETEEKASQYIKDHNQNPDDMVYAYEQSKAGTSAGEALTMRGANAEKKAVSDEYDALRTQAKETGVGAPKPNQAVPDGPLSKLRTETNPTGSVEAKFAPEAQHAEMLIKAPAKDWGEKWGQLQNAGSELIKKRMDFMAAGDKTSAAAMNSLFEGVRNQQKAAAEYVFGKEAGAKVISHLEDLDKRYAQVMSATQGMSYGKMRTVLASGNTPEARDLEKNFREFAKDDPSAIRAFNAMKAGARGDWKSEAALMGPVIAGEVAANMHGVPTVGAISALVGGHRLYKLVQGYMNAKVLGTPVTFKDFLAKEIKSGPAGDAVRGGVERTTLQAQ